ncbi:arsenate reductase (glutaredoxin) [Tardiphaga alba]|uniref:Arsenate reductase n=1 Tax=Tardiphaga alba TaxID=340268 RepID=A0ABX8A987_9BRAD|nr:arsenate reductase (glutaredoxin) [Tardiphaga alba]QUS40319.1 arsenate reductase (glutaredoxin) [Tardiphaga alba]
MTVTIYHNPRCGTSRTTLALLQERGVEPVVIEYLKTPPDRQQLKALAKAVGGVRGLLREKEAVYGELGLADPTQGDDALLDAIAAHPILLNRPVVVTPKGARVCRPAETVLEIL